MSSAVCAVGCGGVTLKLTLSPKLLAKPFDVALVNPFLGAFNKKTGGSLTAAELTAVEVDGRRVTNLNVLAGELLPSDAHTVTLHPPSPSTTGASNPAAGGSDPVERVLSAAHEYVYACARACAYVLELPRVACDMRHTHMHMHTHAHTHAHTHTYTCMHAYTYMHRFAVLELPLEAASQAAVRRAYRRVSLLVSK